MIALDEDRGAKTRARFCVQVLLISTIVTFALYGHIPSKGWTQVNEKSLHAQVEVGSGYVSEGAGGYGALAFGAEFNPAYQCAGRYQLEWDHTRQAINHRPLIELRFQLNVFEVIPWVSATAGASYGVDQLAFTAGGALGADLRLSPTQFLSFSARFAHADVWTLGVAYGNRWVLNDPFDQ